MVSGVAASAGSSLLGFIQAGVGAILRTVQDKLRESVSVLDFGADATGVADSTAAVQAATNTGKAVLFPDGTYKVRDTVADFKRWGQYGDEWEVPITFTTVLKDGHWRHWQKPDFGKEPVITGTFKTKGDIAYFKILAPEGATEIARNPQASQAFVLDDDLAVQFHPELDEKILLGWLANGGDDRARELGVDPGMLLTDTRRNTLDSRLRAHRLVDAFLARVVS